MAKRLAGTCFIHVNGKQIDVTGGLECPLSDKQREAVMAVNGVAGYKETATKHYVKISAVVGDDFPRAELVSGTEMTVTAEFANGSTYVLSGAWLDGDSPAHKNDDGTTDLEFAGMQGVWQ